MNEEMKKTRNELIEKIMTDILKSSSPDDFPEPGVLDRDKIKSFMQNAGVICLARVESALEELDTAKRREEMQREASITIAVKHTERIAELEAEVRSLKKASIEE